MPAVPTVFAKAALATLSPSFVSAVLREQETVPEHIRELLRERGYSVVLDEALYSGRRGAFNPLEKKIVVFQNQHSSFFDENDAHIACNTLHHETGHFIDVEILSKQTFSEEKKLKKEFNRSSKIDFSYAFKQDRDELLTRSNFEEKLSKERSSYSNSKILDLIKFMTPYFLTAENRLPETYAEVYAGIYKPNNERALDKLMPRCAELVRKDIDILQRNFG